MQIINDPSRAGSLASSLGTGLSELADLKLAQLAQKYEQQHERASFVKAWEPKLGKSTATFLSNLSPQERENALSDTMSLMYLNEPPSSREQVRGMQSLGQQQQMPDQQQLLQGLAGEQQQQYPQQAQQQMPGQPPMTSEDQEKNLKLAQQILTSPETRAAQQKLEIEKKKEARAEQAVALKETKTYIDSLKDREKAAKETDLRLKRMEKLIDKGNLPNATLWSALTKIEDLGPIATGGIGALLGSVGGVLGSVVPGIGTAIGAGVGAGVGGAIGSLSGTLAGAIKSTIKTGSPDIEEFEKLSNEFVKGAKQYFGSRITEKEVQMYMQTVPTLLQTDAGKKKIIENIQSLNELVEIEAKAARSIIRKNGGIRPADLEQQVQDKISSKIDKVAKKFIG